ncbi:MAG: DNA-binding protein [Bacteroidaceae bacterium]|nr:DNA-binding protein [Bacteroidaceae bacterium]
MKKIQYSLAMLANPQKPEEGKKAYAFLQLTGIVSIQELARHITEHNSVYSRGTIVGVLTEMCVCMRELILQGYKVDLGGFGTFSPTISSQGAKSKDEFSSNNIKEMGVLFSPGFEFNNLRRDAEFERTISRKAQAATLKAENEGKTQSDWTPEPEEDNTADEGGE